MSFEYLNAVLSQKNANVQLQQFPGMRHRDVHIITFLYIKPNPESPINLLFTNN